MLTKGRGNFLPSMGRNKGPSFVASLCSLLTWYLKTIYSHSLRPCRGNRLHLPKRGKLCVWEVVDTTWGRGRMDF